MFPLYFQFLVIRYMLNKKLWMVSLSVCSSHVNASLRPRATAQVIPGRSAILVTLFLVTFFHHSLLISTVIADICCSLRNFAHAIYREFFSTVEIEISPEKMIVLIFLLQT